MVTSSDEEPRLRGQVWGNAEADPVGAALAEALALAARAGQWGTVGLLARELEGGAEARSAASREPRKALDRCPHLRLAA
jgi:hypothetical protein